MTAIALPPEAAILIGGVFGCLVGSFLNVVVHRLPAMVLNEAAETPVMNLAFPASHCPSCATPLSWRDNIPLASWLLLRGRCRACAMPISWRYPALEALGAAIGALAIWRFGFGVEGLLAAGFLMTLTALAAIDLETGLLPDRATLPLLWAGLIAAAFGKGPDPADAILAAALAYGALTALNLLCRLALGRDGMGGGDAKLAAAIGAWIGLAAIPWSLLISFGAGAVYGILMRAQRTRRANGSASAAADELPFGPWLALGGAALFCWPEIAAVGAEWLMFGRLR